MLAAVLLVLVIGNAALTGYLLARLSTTHGKVLELARDVEMFRAWALESARVSPSEGLTPDA